MTDRKPLQGHFDAKKHAYRQTQDGVVVSFVVDPADITPEFAIAPLGTCLKIAYAEYDPETGQAKEAPKKKRDRKLSELCAMRCKEPEFQQWVLAGKWLPGHAQTWTREEQTKFVVKRACGINTDYGSRAALDINSEAAERWKNLEASYLYHNTPAMEKMG